ncbi:10382_t:CDS:2 [Dentiscutata heterogama]|uniref:10382_t:CDS:1 n=1 Tax=Dentiscutata heterogama TaxID=1316150 RepID=A0ACA9L082_9GLOM|nr:10382_t:CDS:2 [Dentiscutata heterogama]
MLRKRNSKISLTSPVYNPNPPLMNHYKLNPSVSPVPASSQNKRRMPELIEDNFKRIKLNDFSDEMNLDKPFSLKSDYCGAIVGWSWEDINYKDYKWYRNRTTHNSQDCQYKPSELSTTDKGIDE